MSEETLQLAKQVREVIARAGDYSKVSPHEIFMDVEALISSLAYLISPKIEAEGLYRKEIVDNIEKDMSVAESEARAKATELYTNWKKLEAIYNLAEEQIRLAKKFKDDLTLEFQRS